ncbi:hypothetical protein EYB45_04445 [Erythrobacteraceae bacterium CFH 75059]|uniref:hypothetical protein n=1 Tax=Qipengyuania thermophila TaxID=2509361 RepID=UPI001020C480|nr:hypothetical protein [Qipengyuania thermophila]TCD04804.1 hypothetical protein EYB45_04445 [Erythrobacteraceae bacterium CFH 75059]
MGDLTRDSDRLIIEGRRLRDDNRTGGRHRRAGPPRRSVGRGAAQAKIRHMLRKLMRILLAIAAILFAAMVTGLLIGGLGFLGVMLTLFAMVVAVMVFSTFPRIRVPARADLNKGDVKQMVARTELWLEHQRPALPPPAVRIIDDLGVQLDELGSQLQAVDQNHPQVREVRKLVGEILPETVESYRAIPSHLRSHAHAGVTPDEQVTDSLQRISDEVDSISRQLAEGSLDKLAISNRFLTTRYGSSDNGDAP